MIERLYRWTLTKSGSPWAPAWLGGVSFAESSFFPIPPDILLIPMVLARPQCWWRLSLWCTLASVIGGLFGYAIGFFAFQTVGQAIVDSYGLQPQFDSFQAAFAAYGAWVILIKGVTPIPYKLLTITAGVAQLDLAAFMTASLISRGLRFLIVAWVVQHFGPQVQALIERRLRLFGSLVLALVVGGFLAVKLL